MAISRDPSNLLAEFSGRIGNLIVKKYGNTSVLSKIPDMSRRKLSRNQKASNQLWKEANLYAQGTTARADRKARAAELLKVPMNKVYTALVKDYMLKKGDSKLLLKFDRAK